jgi:hypothetical protein
MKTRQQKKTGGSPKAKVTQGAKAARLKAKSAVSSPPKKSKDILIRKNSDGTITAMRLDNDRYFVRLDGIAAELWSMIDGRTSLEKIKEKIIQRHQPPLRRFESDVKRLMKNLVREKLLKI